MFSGSIQIKKNHIQKKIRMVKAAGEEAIDLAAHAILEEALRRVPVATGKLRDGLSIRSKVKSQSTAVGVWGVREALFVEHGTVKMHAKPYLRPGAALGRRTLKAEAAAKVAAAAESGE